MLILFSYVNAHAGGPLGTVSGKAIVYDSSDFPIPYSPDNGPLGSFTNDQATALVDECFQVWEDVSTAAITFQNDGYLPVDVNGANYLTYFNSGDGINPIIFDSDGSIIEDYFGVGLSDQVIGFAGSSYYPEGANAGYYVEGMAVLNGKFSAPVFSYEQFKATFVHEFGHFFGLDHTQINQAYAGDGNTTNDQYIPTMFPIATDDDTSLGNLNPDDEAAITLLYPADNYDASYGKITGTVTWSGGGAVRGANVVAVKNGDEKMSRFSSISDYYMQNDGSYEMLVTPGTYALFIEPIDAVFTGGSSVGPYADTSTGLSFASPVTKQDYSGTVTVSAGETVSNIDFIANGGGSQTTTTTPATTTTPTGTTTISQYCNDDSDGPLECIDNTNSVYWCCPDDYPVCGEDEYYGYCLQDASSSTTTTVLTGTTTIFTATTSTTTVGVTTTISSTTIPPRGPCAASMLFGDKSMEAELFRDFRDEVLLSSDSGKELIEMYYRHALELNLIAGNNTAIRTMIRRVLIDMIPIVESALEGGDLIISISAAKDIDKLCDAISEVAGTELSETIESLQREYPAACEHRELSEKH